MTNAAGTWFVIAPGTANVQRHSSDLHVSCDLEGYESGIAVFKSTLKGMAFGNIVFGGIIGAGVDHVTGAAYQYPPLVTVILRLIGSPPTGGPSQPVPSPLEALPRAPVEKVSAP